MTLPSHHRALSRVASTTINLKRNERKKEKREKKENE